MKIIRVLTLSILCLFLFVAVVLVFNTDKTKLLSSIESNAMTNNEEEKNEEKVDISYIGNGITDGINTKSLSKIATNIERIEVFDGLTMEELTIKLNKSLKGILANKGEMIAKRCLKLGINPYMAVAIMLHETGCSYSCSGLATHSYNFGGLKGGNDFLRFSSVDNGLNAFLDTLYYNYYQYGLNTPEKINPKYAASTTWSSRVRSYMIEIRAK